MIKASEANKIRIGNMEIGEYLINKDFSGALISIKGAHGKSRCLREDRVYFILEGSGLFIIDGKEHTASANDLIFIPKSTPYDIKGNLKFFLLCSPGFRQEDVEMLNE